MKDNWHHMAWIPQSFAILDKVIKIKNEDSTWDDGWVVVGIGENIVKTAEEANAQSQLYKKTRKASDI